MIGKPGWFSARKFGWGLGVRTWQGVAYVMVVAFIYGALFASGIGAELKTGLAVVISVIIIADLLQIMYKVYSNLDEREERHQLVAERNASFTAIAAITVFILYTVISTGTGGQPDFGSLALPVAVLVAMSLVKGVTLLLLEREN
jgi:Kef-type K+ transport system membrane component KefB